MWKWDVVFKMGNLEEPSKLQSLDDCRQLSHYVLCVTSSKSSDLSEFPVFCLF